MLPLAFSDQQQTGQHTVRIGAFGGAGAEADFSEDHQVAKGLFGLVVGGLNIGVFKECK